MNSIKIVVETLTKESTAGISTYAGPMVGSDGNKIDYKKAGHFKIKKIKKKKDGGVKVSFAARIKEIANMLAKKGD